MSLLEMVLALAIISIVFAVILPQFRTIQNSWDSKLGAAETLQNGRVLIEHLNRNLSKAVRITAVSDLAETYGYIEFQDNVGNNLRYDVDANNYVEFGSVGTLSQLAGPVSRLQFTCYDASDLSTPITDVDSIRSVKVETTLTNTGPGQDKSFTARAYIRTNALPSAGGDIAKLSEPWLEYDALNAQYPSVVHMSGNRYVCAYRGDSYDGFACILTVNPADWSVSAAAFVEYDTKDVQTPALAKIDDNNFLCAYQGVQGDGFICILYEMPAGSGTLREVSPLEFDTTDCVSPVLCKIDTQGNDHYYLCAYAAPYEVRALIFTMTLIPGVMMELTNGPIISFPASFSPAPGLAKIDDTHYLCAYEGETGSVHGGAVVLTVNNPVDEIITPGAHFDFFGETADAQKVVKIDDTHYFCFYVDYSLNARATVLTVNPADWTVTKAPGPDFLVQSSSGSNQTCPIDNTNFLCAYRVTGTGGTAAILTVNTSDWTISKKTPLAFEPGTFSAPALCQIDIGHYLCAYCGPGNGGFAGVLELGPAILP